MASALNKLETLEKEFEKKKQALMDEAREEVKGDIDRHAQALSAIAEKWPNEVWHAVKVLQPNGTSTSTKKSKMTKAEMEHAVEQVRNKLLNGPVSVKKSDFMAGFPTISKPSMQNIITKLEQEKFIKVERVDKTNPKLGSTLTRTSK
jgi:hypothetical protein